MDKLLTFGTGKNGQTYFPWGEPKREQTRAKEPHLFYAILVGEPTNALLQSQAGSYSQELGLQGWLTPAEQMHMTLIGLGDGKSEYVINTACRIGSLIQAKPFDVCLDRLSAFGGGALVLRSSDHSPALQHFWRKLSAVVDDSPLNSFVTNSVEPHVTLLRYRNSVPKVQERLVEPVRWTVRNFALICSHKGEYKVPGTWQLTGQDDALAAI